MRQRTQAQFNVLSPEFQHAVLDTLGNFDFVKVERVMEFVEWEYHDGPPDVARLVDSAKYLLTEVAYVGQMKGVDNSCSGGGLRASYSVGDHSLSLEFILEDYDAYVGDNDEG